MSIGQALSSANSGLAAVSRQASVVSQNIANALTPGYSRREASLAEIVVGGVGGGVRVAGVARAEIAPLTADRRAASSLASGLTLRADAIGGIADYLGGPEDANAFFARVSALNDSLRVLANAPDNIAAQSAAVDASKSLASAINQAGASLDRRREDADAAIALQVNAVNAALKSIESLNDSVLRANAAGQDASALLDERDRQIDIVNAAIPVRLLTREGGRVDLMTADGGLLLSGTARTISFSSSPVITPDMTHAGGALSGLSIDGFALNPGNGELAAQFAIRDEIAPQAQADLDAFASELISRFGSAGLDPTLAPGAPGLFTDAGFALSPPPAPGLAQRLEVNAAVDATQGGAAWRMRDGLGAIVEGAPGANAFILAMVGAMDASAPSPYGGHGANILEAAAELANRAGERRVAAASEAQSQSVYARGLAEAEQAQTGVDTDQEMQSLLLIEQAYAANAKVIAAIGEMIDRLMEI
jgi:flagellar hook-associated protein 1 FlgK